MSRSALPEPGLRGILRAAMVMASLILVGAAALMLHAASRLDAIQANREAALVERRLERLQTQMIEDVTSASVWDESVAAILRRDLEWMQLNFGDYYADYMDHETTLVLDGQGGLILASIDSEPVPATRVADMLSATRDLVSSVATQAARPRPGQGVGLDAAVSQGAFIRVGDAIHQVVAVTVVPENPGVARPERDPIIVSSRPIDYVLNSLEVDLAIEAPRYDPVALSGAGRSLLRDLDGRPLGHIRWVPQKPGMGVVMESLPVLLLLLVGLGGAGFLLMRRMNAIMQRLEASENALVEARDRAEAASEAKTRFLSNISHELRTPLNGIMGMAEVLGMGPLSPHQQGHLKVLKASGADLLKLIEHLLAVTRLERRSEAPPEVETFDLGALLTTALDSRREAAEAKGLTLAMSNTVSGDRIGARASLEQALGYLLENALGYTETGGVRLDASEHDDRVLITVSDTGIGISPDVLPRLFDPFVQGDESSTRRFEGAGLGLSICQGLVKAMGGQIHVDSAIGRGSRFTLAVSLPRASLAAGRDRLAA